MIPASFAAKLCRRNTPFFRSIAQPFTLHGDIQTDVRRSFLTATCSRSIAAVPVHTRAFARNGGPRDSSRPDALVLHQGQVNESLRRYRA